MKNIVIEFMWKHLKKLIVTAVTAFGYLAWNFLQMPYEAAADIKELKSANVEFAKELKTLQVNDGVNNTILLRVETKLDKLQETVIKYSVQRRIERR